MDAPKLPGLTGKTEAELRKIYDEHIGGELPAGLDTVPKLIQGIKEAYATKYPDASKEPVAPAAVATADDVPEGYLTAVHEDGRVKHFAPSVWASYGKNTQGYKLQPAKPASLPRA